MKDQTRVIAALLIGAAAGAALGLLLAPEKGEKVREDIADYVNDLIDAAKDKAVAATNDLKGYSNDVYDRAKTRFNGIVTHAADLKDTAVETAKAKVQDLTDEAKSKVKNNANDLNHSIQNS
jgi:gas vesicle protein